MFTDFVIENGVLKKYKGKSADVVILDSVIGIGDGAFSDCRNLTSISIPDSVTSIGKNAFEYCVSLSNIMIPGSVKNIGEYAFRSCFKLKDIIIPDGITSIERSAFENCNSLTSILIPDSVTSIEKSAFKNCRSLTSIIIPDSVTSIGERGFFDCESLTSVTVPASVESIGDYAFGFCFGNSRLKSVTIQDGVTSIGKGVFYRCNSLTSVIIPNSVTSIGEGAFYGCNSLTSVIIPNSVTSIGEGAFYGCNSLTSVIIPNSVTSIGKGAFYDCSRLARVTIPDSVTSIGWSAFLGCSSLTSVTIPDSVTQLGGAIFANCHGLKNINVNKKFKIDDGALLYEDSKGIQLIFCFDVKVQYNIPKGVNGIWPGAFWGCRSLTHVTIPSSVTRIGSEAFSGCSNLMRVTIPNSVTSIEDSAFSGCSSLKSITIPYGVTGIEEKAFFECKSLTSITIPDSVTSIGKRAFEDCSSLTSIILPDSVTSIGERAFSGCCGLMGVIIPENVKSIRESAFSNCSGLMSIIIPESVTSIGESVFWACSSLTSVTIPDKVTNIGDYVFYGCSGLTSVTIPESVTSIGKRLFSGCSGLTSVTIPENVTSIGEEAFSGCSGLTGITIPSSVMNIGEGAFSGCSGLMRVKIPESVTSIGARAFSGCSSLTNVTIPENVMSIGYRAFEGCSSLTSVKIPAGVTSIGKCVFYGCGSLLFVEGPEADGGRNSFAFFKSVGSKLSFLAYASSSESNNLDDFAKPGSWGKYDSELINNGPTYKYRLPARLVGVVGRLLDPVELTDSNHDLLMELARKNVKKYIPLAEAAVCPELVKALFDLGIINTQNEKAVRKLLTASNVPEISMLASADLKANIFSVKTGSEKKEESESPLEREYICKLNNIKGDRIIKNMKLIGVSIPSVSLKDGTQAPDSLFRFILASYGSQIGGEYHIDKDADNAAKLVSYDSLCDAMDAVSGKLAGAEYPSTLPVLCRFGSVQQVKSLIASWKEWGDWKRYKKKGRVAQEILEQCMILSDTREAVVWLEKKNQLVKYAKIRGISESEVYEKYLFDCGFDKNGKKIFDLGLTTIEASMTKDLKVELYDTSKGKKVRSIPKKGIDPAIQKKAANEVMDLRHNLKKIARIKNDQIFKDYIEGKGIAPSRWKKSYSHNPLLRRIASLLVWEQGNKTFIQTENGPIDNKGEEYALAKGCIRVAHPMEMKQDEVAAWQEYFIAHNLKQPFSQIWEPVYKFSDIRPDRYKGIAINPHYLMNQRKRGIYAEWYCDEYIDSKYLSIDGFDVKVEDAPMDDTDRYEERMQITSIKPCKWNRQANTIIAFLDRITIYGRIKKDDLSVMALMDGFTLEQVSDFINVALKNKAVNLLAALMDYKNEHFAGYNPMDSFLLEDF